MEITKRENLYKGYYQLDKLYLQEEGSTEIFDREQFIVPNSVGIIVEKVATSTIIMVEQFRVGPEQKILEIVAGKREFTDGDPGETAIREVMEETGYAVKSLKEIARFYPSPGPLSEEMILYWAEAGEKVAAGGGLESENENIRVIEIPKVEFLEIALHDAKSIIAQQWLKLQAK